VDVVGVVEDEEALPAMAPEPAPRAPLLPTHGVEVEALVEAAHRVDLRAAREGGGGVAGVLQDLGQGVHRGVEDVRRLPVLPELDGHAPTGRVR